MEIARAVFKDMPSVEIDTFDGLLVDYVERREAQVIVRGLRAVSDFEFEFQMALMNQRLNDRIETVFMMPAEQYTYISSRLIKEVFSLGGRVHGLVPDMVEQRLREKVSRRRTTGRRTHEDDMTRLAERTTRIASSPTMKVTATVDRLRREGIEVIDFGAGEPDFGTPAAINAAAKAAIDQDFTKYTPVGGIADLKRAICDRYRTDYGVEYKENEVITCAGGKQALYNTALTLFNPGDEVITHTPYWPTLTEQVKLAEATPVLVPDVAGRRLRDHAPSRSSRRSPPRTRGIIINSPATRPGR